MPSKNLTAAEIVQQYPREWFALSMQQRFFVQHFFATGDAIESVFAAYPKMKTAKVETARVWKSRLLANPKIKKILALSLGLSEAELLLANIESLLKKARRKGADMDVLVAPLHRVAKALENYATQNKSAS